MVTGVSLKGADAALVLLQEGDNCCQPISLAIKGNYNRLGSIDVVEEDASTGLVLKYFLENLQTGAFVVDAEYLQGHEFYPIDNIERLLGCFERNINDHDQAAVLNGRRIVFALISKAVWETIARSERSSDNSAVDCFHRLFPDVAIAQGIYRQGESDVSQQLNECWVVNCFLNDQNLTWTMTEAGGQHFAEEMLQYLNEARRRFGESDVMRMALDWYEREICDLLDDD